MSISFGGREVKDVRSGRRRGPRKALTAVLACCAFVALGAGEAGAAGGGVELVSISSSDVEANGSTESVDASADGRYVVFESSATNLVPGITSSGSQIYLRDRVTGAVELISHRPDGGPGTGTSSSPKISDSGGVVTFQSNARDLVENDTNGRTDIFVYEVFAQRMNRIVLASNVQLNGHSTHPDISGDGKYVAFASNATNVTTEAVTHRNIFRFDRTTGTIMLLTRGNFGATANGHSDYPSISRSGRQIAFETNASNLMNGDTNGTSDVYVTHVLSESGEGSVISFRMSQKTSGLQGNSGSHRPAISDNGNVIAYHSTATNLVNGDTNGLPDVFVTSLYNGITTRRVSTGYNLQQANGSSTHPSLSADGTKVSFQTKATNLAHGDTNGDIYDIVVGKVLPSSLSDTRKTIVSRGRNGGSANLESGRPSISPDGTAIAFVSRGTNLVPGQSNEYSNDAFIWTND